MAITTLDNTNSSLQTNNVKRCPTAVSDVAWAEQVSKGTNLISAMNAKDELAAAFFKDKSGSLQSPFVSRSDLEDWGWKFDFEPERELKSFAGPDLYDMYRDVRFNIDSRNSWEKDPGPVVAIGRRHAATVSKNGVEYRPTGALYGTIFNVKYGVLVGWQKFGPRTQAKHQTPPVTVLPDLQHWSDVVFIDWLNIARRNNLDVSNLKYIVSAIVANPETITILQRALGVEDVESQCRRWTWGNHRDFSMSTDEGRALLASPNGRGAAHLLIEHKNYFGARTTIDKVTFWCALNEVWEIHLMFCTKKQPDEPGTVEVERQELKRNVYGIQRQKE